MYYRIIALLITLFSDNTFALEQATQAQILELTTKMLKQDNDAKYQLAQIFSQPDTPYFSREKSHQMIRELAQSGHEQAKKDMFTIHSDPSNSKFSASRALFWHRVANLSDVSPFHIAALKHIEQRPQDNAIETLFDDNDPAYHWYQGLLNIDTSQRSTLIIAREHLIHAHTQGLDMTRWLSKVNAQLFSPVVMGVRLLKHSEVDLSSLLSSDYYSEVTQPTSSYVSVKLTQEQPMLPSYIVSLTHSSGHELALFFENKSAEFYNLLKDKLETQLGPIKHLTDHVWHEVGLSVQWRYLDNGTLKLTYITQGV